MFIHLSLIFHEHKVILAFIAGAFWCAHGVDLQSCSFCTLSKSHRALLHSHWSIIQWVRSIIQLNTLSVEDFPPVDPSQTKIKTVYCVCTEWVRILCAWFVLSKFLFRWLQPNKMLPDMTGITHFTKHILQHLFRDKPFLVSSEVSHTCLRYRQFMHYVVEK